MATEECPFATHLLYFKCGKCEKTDMVFCKNAKDWKCPNCAISDQYRPSGEAMDDEIKAWRNHFLEESFERDFKHTPDSHKNRIWSYFMSIPSESFTDPISELHKCISVMLQHMEDRK